MSTAPEKGVLYSNRCAALLKLGRVKEARLDAEACRDLRPDWEKAHYRLGAVWEAEGDWEKVRSDRLHRWWLVVTSLMLPAERGGE